MGHMIPLSVQSSCLAPRAHPVALIFYRGSACPVPSAWKLPPLLTVSTCFITFTGHEILLAVLGIKSRASTMLDKCPTIDFSYFETQSPLNYPG